MLLIKRGSIYCPSGKDSALQGWFDGKHVGGPEFNPMAPSGMALVAPKILALTALHHPVELKHWAQLAKWSTGHGLRSPDVITGRSP